MEKTNRRNMRNKTQKGVLNKKSILNNYLTSILKLNLALALFFFIIISNVSAGDVTVKSGDLNVSQDLLVNTNTLYVDSTNNKVGIGTPTPSEELTVAGNTIISGMLNATSFYQSGNIVLDASTAAYIGNCSADLSCDAVTYDSELSYTVDTNCSAADSCPLIAYDSELAYIGNCSSDDSCALITYDSETSSWDKSTADDLVDSDFGSSGLMKTDGAGSYSTITDSSSDWNSAYSTVDANHTLWDTAYLWGDHSAGNYLDLDTYPNTDTDSTDDYTSSDFTTDYNAKTDRFKNENMTSAYPNLDTDSTNDLTTSSSFGGDISGAYNAIQVKTTQGLSITNLTDENWVEDSEAADWDKSAADDYKKENLTTDYPNIDTDNTDDYTSSDFATDYAGTGAWNLANYTAVNLTCAEITGGAGLCDGVDADTPDTTIGNCSAEGSCPLVAYNTELIHNCSADGSCDLITYDSETTAWDKSTSDDWNKANMTLAYPNLDTDSANDILNNSEAYFSKVGIGTGTLSDMLHIEGNLAGKGITLNSSTGVGLWLRRASDNKWTGIRFFTEDEAAQQKWIIGNTGDSNNNMVFEDTEYSTQPFTIEPDTASYTLYLDSNDNVGIGTSSPDEKLEVHGNLRFDGAARTITTGSSGGAGYSLTIQPASGDPAGSLYLGAGDTEPGNVYVYGGNAATDGKVVLGHTGSTTQGNVGIRTTSASSALSVYGGICVDDDSSCGSVGNGDVGLFDGGMCVDDDGFCNVPTDGEISAAAFNVDANPDLAEMYEVDDNVTEGDVVCMHNNGKMGYCSEAYDTSVTGAVSSTPGMILNSKCGGADTIPVYNEEEEIIGYTDDETACINYRAIVLKGSAPVKVICDTPIEIGEVLVSASQAGYAQSIKSATPQNLNQVWQRLGSPFAKALEPCSSGTGTIKAWFD